MYRRLSPTWEPQAPPISQAKPVLAVLFGSIFEDVEKEKEMIRLINEPYGPIGPDGPYVKIGWDKYRYFAAFGLKTKTKKDIYDNSGTLSDIYDIAAEAKAAGWKAVLLADELTWRQHTGTVSSIEDPERTVTVVNIDCVDCKALLRPESTFFIRRLPLKTAIGECVLPEAQKPLGFVVQRQQASFRETLRNGFYLRCPDEPIFSYSSNYNKPWMQSQALDRLIGKARLPQELRDKIMSYVNEDEVRPLRTLINMDQAISLSQARKTFVQPLVPLTNEERQVIEAHPDFKDRFCNFYLGEWKDAFPASRRDVSRILRHFCDARDRIIFILRPPAEDGTIDSAVAYLSTDNASGPAYVVFRQYREHAHCNNPAGRHSPNDRVNAASQRRPGTEVFLDPEWTFPPGLPYWHKHTAVKNSSRRKRRRLHPHPILSGVDTWLRFYLTSSLNEEERNRVENILVGDSDDGHTNTYHDEYERGFSIVPWTKNVDGGRDDMLRLFHMAYHADSTIGDCAVVGAVAFIDRQSAQDNKVVVGAKWTDSQSFFKGLQFVRRNEYIVHALEPFQNIGTPVNWVFTDDVVDHIEDPDWIPVGGHLTRRDMRRSEQRT